MKKVLRLVKKSLKRGFYILEVINNFFVFRFIIKFYNSFIIGVPTYGNLGDIAISYAQRCLLRDLHVKFKEITFDEYYRYKRFIIKFCKNKLVFLQGGGNMGDVWQKEEDIRRDILSNIKASHFIIFPQTIYYTNSANGQMQKEESIAFYSHRKDLTIFVREKQSYDIANLLYKGTDVYLVPDIVLYLYGRYSFNIEKKHDVLFVLRKDIEKKITNEFINQIVKQITNLDIFFTDTLVCKKITKKRRKREINRKIKEFASCNLIITDRLHGMIFACLANTPCIAFDNNSNKVSGVYKWVEKTPSVVVIDDEKLFSKKLLFDIMSKKNVIIEKMDYSSLKESIIKYANN